MRLSRLAFFPLALIALSLASLSDLWPGTSPAIDPRLLTHRWKAWWIGCPDGPRREFGVFHFRRTFQLDPVPERFVIHASGDNRYELYVNGRRIVAGPARGDLNHWRFDTLDIAEYLKPGKNVLAAVVWNFAELAPMAQISNETALIVQGDGTAEAAVNTNDSWRCFRNPSITMIPPDREKVDGYFVAGPGEQVDGSRYPWGWETTDYPDASWKAARAISQGSPRGIQDSPSRWMLVPRSIPFMEEKAERLVRVVRTQGVQVGSRFLQGDSPVTLPAHTRATILLDQSYLTTAYPELTVSGGRGAQITLAYAEALWQGRDKGNRDETDGKQLRGLEDRFLPDGGSHRLFRPLWWRTYRYLEIEVETGAEPVVLEDLKGLFTAYPFQLRATFESDDPTLRKIWEVGWRTARLCAHETYMDCPYYEQLQYVGDTRIQAPVSLYMSGDDRLMKNAIELMHESRTPEGLTQSRYPSWLPQYIPPFSLFWIGMMHDLWWHRGEQEFLRQYLPGARNVLGWFEERLAPSGLLGRLEWWNFVDWCKEFPDGVPPMTVDGESSILSLQFIAALRQAADLEADFGSAERTQHYRTLAAKISEAVRKTCWDETRGLVADTPAKTSFSQHANVLAVLENVIPEAKQPAVMETVLNDATLIQCTYYFQYYLFQAMKKVGLANQYLDQLGPWHQMLALGLTTWAETPEPARSDCHAWSAHPNLDLLAAVAGIQPGAPGFTEVSIRPHLGPLNEVTAAVPHPQGEIRVRFRRMGQVLAADVWLPRNLSGWLYWQLRKVPLRGGHQHIVFR